LEAVPATSSAGGTDRHHHLGSQISCDNANQPGYASVFNTNESRYMQVGTFANWILVNKLGAWCLLIVLHIP
jgi:hypothetical protein